jgi:hypothetical protein
VSREKEGKTYNNKIIKFSDINVILFFGVPFCQDFFFVVFLLFPDLEQEVVFVGKLNICFFTVSCQCQTEERKKNYQI